MQGTYSFLNRLLYYCIFIFSLFSRAHLWLVAGALAAALTYSGTAAVHACLLVWRGPNPYIENDSWLLYEILNAACLITVPLLNWSGTLRRLGAKAASMRDPKRGHTQSDVGTRTIVVYWAFLVLVGFICIWSQILFGEGETNMEYPDMNKVMCASGTNASMLMSSNGTFHRRAIDSQFIQANGCTDPCNQVDIPSIFRQQSDLVLLDHQKALLWNETLPGTKYQKAYKLLTNEDKLFNLDYYTLPFILIQGFVSAFFGRRDPREIRDLIYIKLFLQHPLSHNKPFLHRTQDILVRFLAAFNYGLAVAVILLCPPLFLVTLISAELQFWGQQPDSEEPYAVGQWGPWAVTCQVLLAALIARYHDKVISLISTTGHRIISPRRRHQHEDGVHQATDYESGRTSSTTTKANNNDLLPLHANPNADKPDTRPIISPLQVDTTSAANTQTPSPSPTPKPKPSLWHRCHTHIHKGYQMLAHPLNQSDRGMIDEIRNFAHWCRDPQAVSRLVIRHPVRPRDERSDDNDDDGSSSSGKGQGDGESHKENNGNYHHQQGEKSDGGEAGNTAGVQHVDVNGVKMRLDSGFFRAASVDRNRNRDRRRGA